MLSSPQLKSVVAATPVKGLANTWHRSNKRRNQARPAWEDIQLRMNPLISASSALAALVALRMARVSEALYGSGISCRACEFSHERALTRGSFTKRLSPGGKLLGRVGLGGKLLLFLLICTLGSDLGQLGWTSD